MRQRILHHLAWMLGSTRLYDAAGKMKRKGVRVV